MNLFFVVSVVESGQQVSRELLPASAGVPKFGQTFDLPTFPAVFL